MHLPAPHGQLVAQHEDLQVLGGVAAGQQDEQSDRAAEVKVGELRQHAGSLRKGRRSATLPRDAQANSQLTGHVRLCASYGHLAVAIRFHQLDDAQWCLSLRPERHLTRDGATSLPAEQIGRRVTRLKARMYNGAYLGEVNFWRDYLARGHPRIILDFGDQAAIITAELLTFTVRWPGIPGDAAAFTRRHADDDLFSIAELTAAVDGDPLDPDDPNADDLQERGA